MSKPITCTCGTKPEVWDETFGIFVMCPNCYREVRGDTYEDACENWNEFIKEEMEDK